MNITSRPLILDTYCGEGGTAKGLIEAGCDVVGVDSNAAVGKRYPGEFIHGNALTFLAEHGREFDGHVSGPPCQGYSISTAGNPSARAKYQRLIAVTRELLVLTGKPYVIENVAQARDQLIDPVLLCGRMFGLEAEDEDGERLVLDRHRLFEANFPLLVPEHPEHGDEQVAGVYGGSRRAKRLPGESLAEVAPRDRYAARYERHGGYVPRSLAVRRRLMGIDWMTAKGMSESIPPVYGKHLGLQLVERIVGAKAA